MTLDSSALIAVLFAETGYLDLVDRILTADDVRAVQQARDAGVGDPEGVADAVPAVVRGLIA